MRGPLAPDDVSHRTPAPHGMEKRETTRPPSPGYRRNIFKEQT